ncbi:hypothetical protein RND71_041486 [Anisodus tanguticus]|uniref:Uncharacterized protein n=1 Tax=Anisodus tanguticus TaxID=243964 RepID=A0AAE1QVI3_9SOLA|nr:hypothetical protein RND71_041486 [Anisodus tanguticus]
MATVASTCGPKLEALAHIDISKLSQSELQTLSLCSDSAYNLRRTNDVVIPQIDRSLFNESAGSRRQTYSRIRHQHRRSRMPGHHPSTSQPKPGPTSDPETHAILHFLKYFIHNPNSNSPPPPPPPPLPPLPPVNSPATQLDTTGIQETNLIQEKTLILMSECDKKRKRGRKPKANKKNGVEIVNKNGEVVDLNNLESNGDKLYNGELEKRTVGLKTEEEVLGFVRDLEGQWCSRRKRRKYIDASGFGDTLPIGWKLLLALRRRDNRVWVYCRRYVSPTGQQFISCKEASSYLRSHFSSGEANQLTQQVDDTVSKSVNNFHGDTSLVLSTNIQKNPHSLQKGDVAKKDIVAHAVVPSSSTLDLHLSEVSLMEMDNLPEVKVQDIFECYKCNLTFEEKNAYLQHLFSVHQRTTRRYRVGPSVGDGVIIRDGKYECQFCHKVFEERRSYNGHVGVHVRNNARGTMEFTFPQNSTQDGLASSSEPMVQPFHNSTGILSGSSKDNVEFSAIGQNLDNGTGFEELRLDEMEHFEYSFDVCHESPSLPVASIGLGNEATMEEAFASVGFDSGGIILNMEDQLSTVCVWCRAEFKLEAYDTEAHSDSIGFMCPDCKAKISGHLESGLSMSPHGF